MASSLLDSLTSLITPNVVSKAASQFGESEGAMARALPAAIPTLLAGLLGKANDTTSMSRVMDLLKDPVNDGSALSNVTGLLSGGGAGLSGLASKFLSLLFGDRTSAIGGALGQSTGVRSSTASSILAFAAPLLLSFLGKRTRSENLNAGGLSSLLLGQKDSILAALPSGLGSLLGFSKPAAPVPAAMVEPARRSNVWIWPLILLALLGLWLLLRKRPDKVVTMEPPAAPASGLIARSVCGVELQVSSNGIETRLVGFIEDKGLPISDTTWFEFDRLTFETNSATLKPESSAQLRNVAEILKCYPTTKAKIGGYTDNTGDPAANRTLSQARADSVMRELLALGVAADRLSAEGYGAEHPIADNATEEGRAKNRRIAVRVDAR